MKSGGHNGDGAPRFPGIPAALDGSQAVVEMETAASEAAGAYPITPSTQMGEGWALAVAQGKRNVNGRTLIFFEPEGEHAAAAVTAGMSLVGLRATNFSSGQGIAYMHESLYAAVGKRLPYVLNMACRAITKHALNVHAGHDDYHAVDDTGFFQLFAKNVQESADLTLIAHRIAELSLNPGISAQDGFLTSHVIESMRLPEPELIKTYLGDPSDMIAPPTPAQRMVFGESRRRIPQLFDVDYPAMLGVVQNQDSYAQGVAAQRPFYFDHLAPLADQAFEEFAALSGRRYARASGYRMDDAEYVLVGQGSIVWNAEAVADYLRQTRRLRVGVVNLTMFRPFPSDRVAALLTGRKAVVVLERVDQPLAADPPLLREIRAAMLKAVENGRSPEKPAYPGIQPCRPHQLPDFFSGCFGLGSRDVQPGDLVAAVENVLPEGAGRRQFYLGIDFVRPGTPLPKLELWQQQLLEAYPHLKDLALHPGEAVHLHPKDALAIRIHSVGGWGAITMGKNLALTASELLGLHIKANPKYGSEKKGQPTTFYATLAAEPIRVNAELKQVDVVLSPDPNVFRHSDPIAGLSEGGVFVIQSERDPAAVWDSLPATAQREIRRRHIRVFGLDGFAIAAAEASEAEHRYRMQGAAFLGAFFKASPLMARHQLDENRLFEGLHKQLGKKFGHLGERIVEDNLRVIRRGWAEVREVDYSQLPDNQAERGVLPVMPRAMAPDGAAEGVGHPGRFWEQVGFLYRSGQDGIADPFAAMSAIPAATSTLRDMTDVRFEVPEFIAENCTGCAQCWVQCPDAAIPGLVSTVDQLLDATVASLSNGRTFDKLRPVLRPLARETQKILAGPVRSVVEALSQGYTSVVERMGLDPERRAAADAEFAVVRAAVAEFPLAKTAPFFDRPEAAQKGSGGLLSITVNPEACKGCNICVDVCPDQALITVKQDEAIVERLRRNWALWQRLPDTDDRYVNVPDLEEGVGVLSSLLLKKDNYRSMFGGDGACMGCGEKTALHLVYSAVNSLMRPRVARQVARLDDLISRLDHTARELLSAEADLEQLDPNTDTPAVPLSRQNRVRVDRITHLLHGLKDLRWRYTEGPSGKGRAPLGIANATGCSSVWGSTYPYNPYPFPWVNHLFQDAPSIAIGIFEGQMRKMADGFALIRRAELELAGEYDPEVHEPQLARFDWRQFTDEEFALSPPLFAVGGDGAMLDIGFQNLSRLLASGKPIRVVVLDTQVYSNTGGQACTSGFTGQVSDMAAWGRAQHGKEEVRKELALLAIAHRNAYVLQGSQANPSHLLAGVIRGLHLRRPSVFSLHCPCPPEHGLPDDGANRAAKLALESRAFPILVYDPELGDTPAECLSLEGNPALDETWPAYDLKYLDENGAEQVLQLPLTIADWAATESRFRRHFSPVAADAEEETLVPFHQYLELAPEERDGKTPFIWTLDRDRHLIRFQASGEIVALAEDRQRLWRQLKQTAGLEVADSVREMIGSELEAEFQRKAAEIRAGYERQIAELQQKYPQVIARRLAELLLKSDGNRTITEILSSLPDAPAGAPARRFDTAPAPAPAPVAAAVAAAPPVATATAAAPAAAGNGVAVEEPLVIEPWIDSARCTSCDECTGINRKLFAYNEKKQAYIKDPKAGSFKDLVTAAERCPVAIIHPGTPLNPKEKGLDKLLVRAARFA